MVTLLQQKTLVVTVVVTNVVFLCLDARRVMPQWKNASNKSTNGVPSYSTFQRPEHVSIPYPLDMSYDNACNSFLLYSSAGYAGFGIGNQLNTYVLAVILATSLGRDLVVLDPPFGHAKGHQFGCPSATQFSGLTKGCLYPSGLGRIVRTKVWLGKNCTVPCGGLDEKKCYETWLARANANDLELKMNSTVTFFDFGGNVSILPLGGSGVRRFSISHRHTLFANISARIKSLGASSTEQAWFTGFSPDASRKNKIVFWNSVCALLTRAGILSFQPWIAHDVHDQIKHLSNNLNFSIQSPYTAVHVRRGDKLKRESKGFVTAYWAKNEYRNKTQPTNYIPLNHYLSLLSEKAPRDIYIATDDPETVGHEIAVERNRTGYLRFYARSQNADVGHTSKVSDLDIRYRRTISAITDLLILTRSDFFIGEFSSNWGRFIFIMRCTFINGTDSASPGEMRIAFGTRISLPGV